MRVETKNVYYCDFCRKHRLSRYAMEQHESRCTLNPDRRCRWQTPNDHGSPDYRALAVEMREREFGGDAVEWLRGEVDGCPACMLAVLRQSGLQEFHYADGERVFDYDKEVARLRDEERSMRWGDEW